MPCSLGADAQTLLSQQVMVQQEGTPGLMKDTCAREKSKEASSQSHTHDSALHALDAELTPVSCSSGSDGQAMMKSMLREQDTGI
jgi:hypothetical protein